MLFVKSGIGDYYYMIGGAVHMGETSEKCIEREIFEEAGLNAHIDHLAVVCENFFKGIGGEIDGFDCHTLEFITICVLKMKRLPIAKSKQIWEKN
jgi:8-oxo-dGTP pyrophosphatase MutT (NUDIX family)